MARPTRVVHNDKPLDGLAMDFTTLKEDWNEYRLEDGSVVRVKLIPMEIVRTNEKNHVGDPLVLVQTGILVQVRSASDSDIPPEGEA